MIPKLQREHVERALQHIDAKGVPPGRDSRKFYLVVNDRRYPPKYVLSLASYYACGRELRPEEFGGGSETNRCLRALGYVIEDQTTPRNPRRALIQRLVSGGSRVGGQHDERCPSCKDTLFQMLKLIYGGVERNCRLEAATLPEHYRNSPWHAELEAIFRALASHRGFAEFVKTSNLPNCDYFVPKPGFVVEFDESQHFTECRRITLERYPEALQVGYDRARWIGLCESHKSQDNDPPYRDEQRAWYDTLRDFLPSTRELYPTVRLYAREMHWCDLNPTVQDDVEVFKSRLEGRRNPLQTWKLRVAGDPRSTIGRIIIDGPWSGETELAARLLEQVAKFLPQGAKTEFLMTPGAFIRFGSPDSLPHANDRIHPNPEVAKLLFHEAREQCRAVLSDQLREHLRRYARYLSIGIDSKKSRVSQTQQFIHENHVEMVCLVDLQTGDCHITGKSYPTPQQEKHLLRITDLASHFIDLDSRSVMVLGCHDLTIFNPRAQSKAKSWRSDVNREFRRIASERRPTVVLHHPHTTIKTTTWLHAWNGLLRELPSARVFAGSGRYSSDDAGWAHRHPLNEVLMRTASHPVLDIIVNT